MWDCWHSVFLVMHRQGGLVKINNQNRKIFFGFKRLFFKNNSILIARQFYRYSRIHTLKSGWGMPQRLAINQRLHNNYL